MVIAWLACAWASAPAGVDLEDLDAWSARAAAALRGPAGCWEVEGHRTWAWWELGTDARADAQEPVHARLQDGAWSGTEAWGAFQPVVGRTAAPAAASVLARLEALHGAVEVAWVRWDEDRGVVALEEEVGLATRGAARRRWRFAGAVPVQAEATYPSTPLEDGARLIGAGWEVRFAELEGGVVPVEEFVVARVRTRDGLVRAHQSLRWTSWTPCGGT